MIKLLRTLGTSIVMDFWNCNRAKLNDADYLLGLMSDAAKHAGATIVSASAKNSPPCGVSVMVVIQESHLGIHTWPEEGYGAVDLFTCGTSVDPYRAARMLTKELEAETWLMTSFPRGIPGRTIALDDIQFPVDTEVGHKVG